ncbi:MAG: cell division protein FtsQ [Rhizobacter sp.]|nr:cell division protein FtsQ [Rhizobacter sp.]
MPTDVRLMTATANALFVLAALAFAGLALSWLVRLPMFSIRGVEVDGDVGRNSVATIRSYAVSRLAGNFFTMNLAKSREAFESVPWVRRAVVSRVWPNRIAVHLEEHKPVALWGDDKLVNAQGEVFEANLGDVEDDNLPQLDGPDDSARQMLELYATLVQPFETIEAHVDTLTLSARGTWRADLDTGAAVELGRGTPTEVLARTQRFIGTLGQVTSRYQRPFQFADLRHNDGYAVRLKGVTTSTATGAATPARKPARPMGPVKKPAGLMTLASRPAANTVPASRPAANTVPAIKPAANTTPAIKPAGH